MKHFGSLILLFLLVLLSNPLYSQEVIQLNDGDEDISINDYTATHKNFKATINDINKIVAAPAKDFEKNTNFQEVNYGFEKLTGWCKFTVKNNSNRRNWIVKVHQARVDTAQMYVLKNNKLIKYPLTGHFQHISDRAVYSVHFAYKISLDKNESATFYLYTQRKFGRHAAVLSVQQERYFIDYQTNFIIYISIICGFLFLAGVSGIVLCSFVYRIEYVYYSIYCFGFLILWLTDTGFLHSFFSNIFFPDLMNNTNMVFYYWVVGWHILFTIELLGVNKITEKWTYYTGYSVGILFCVFAIILLFPVPYIVRQQLSLLSYYIIFFGDIYILYAIFIRIVESKTIAYFYLAGFLFTLLAASVAMLADLQIFSNINQKTDYFYITPVVEIIFMLIGLCISFSRAIKEKINTQVQLNQTQNEIINIQEDERKRIAQDLHDDVGNSIMALKNILIHNKEAYNIEHEIDKILIDVRSISHNLMPVNFNEYALNDIIKQNIYKFQHHPTTKFDYDETGEIIKLNSVTELVIYRIFNELITNIVKHAQATQVMIQLIYQETSLLLMVEDNGLGMSDKKNGLQEGIGLKNIRHRVAYINALINVESDQKGTLIIIEIPYESNR